MNKISFLLFFLLFALTQSVTQTQVLNCARKQIGKPYAFNAAGPDKFDSSGLAYYCHNNAIPRECKAQALGNGQSIKKTDIQPGDLMFWNCDEVVLLVILQYVWEMVK